MSTFQLDSLSIDAIALGSQGSAILGIRDSGKSYSATLLAEHLFDAGIPFVAFDPIGVWRFLRVPGAGRGYPVVVAGGQDGHLPLTVASASAIVRAAMQNGVSLVIDLFDINLSKADWKRIVTACMRVLLHENSPHGLRHVFIEEAAEFAPQRVGPDQGAVYAEIEKLARMGGNARLGYTLINQRAEEVNKAVLELCDNLFLHRQKGRNSLTALTKWLDVGDVKDGRGIIKTLPTLPTGECWAWLAGTERPVHIKVPRKNSFHPDRRVMRGVADAEIKGAVDVGAFVEKMRTALEAQEIDTRSANAPAKRDGLKPSTLSGEEVARAIADAEQRGFDRAFAMGVNAISALWSEVLKIVAPIEIAIEQLKQWNWDHFNTVDGRSAQEKGGGTLFDAPSEAWRRYDQRTDLPRSGPSPSEKPAASPVRAATHSPQAQVDGRSPATGGDSSLTGPQQRMIDVISFWHGIGYHAPTREQIAAVCGYSIKSSTIRVVAGALKTAGLIEYPADNTMCLTPEGQALARRLSPGETKSKLESILSGAQIKVVGILRERGGKLRRPELIQRAGYSEDSSTHRVVIGGLNTLGVVEYPERGVVQLSRWATEVLAQ